METATKQYPVNEKIRTIILESELNASQFAEAIGVQRSTISHILSHRNRPGTEILQRITRWNSKYSFDWLMEGADEGFENHRQNTVNQEVGGQKKLFSTPSDLNKKNLTTRTPIPLNPRGTENPQKNTFENDPPAAAVAKPRSPVQINILYDDGSYEVIPVATKRL